MPRLCEQSVRRIAGTVSILGIVLAWTVHPWLIWITAFVGLNLIQSSFTGFCPAERMLSSCSESDRT
ncbi:MAG: DUF2892 domain-containing protein [Halorubrum sp.]